MAIELNHTVVSARDKVASAKFFARIFGLPFEEDAVAYFAPARANDSLTMDFANSTRIAVHHYAFKVGEEDFDAVFGRSQAEDIRCGSEPKDREINHRGGGRGVYFCDPDGHILELLTVTQQSGSVFVHNLRCRNDGRFKRKSCASHGCIARHWRRDR